MISPDPGSHHVHFPEGIETNTDIHVQMKGDNILNVHLGFLRHLHQYEVQFTVLVSPHSKSLKVSPVSLFVVVGTVVCQGRSKSKYTCTIGVPRERDRSRATQDDSE